jgi:hypothetical protein
MAKATEYPASRAYLSIRFLNLGDMPFRSKRRGAVIPKSHDTKILPAAAALNARYRMLGFPQADRAKFVPFCHGH